MKKIVLVCLLIAWASSADAGQPESLKLEPCVNGGVSTSGTHVTDQAEVRAKSVAVVSEAGSLALEPCMNGGVSATGRYQTQSMEDNRAQLLAND